LGYILGDCFHKLIWSPCLEQKDDPVLEQKKMIQFKIAEESHEQNVLEQIGNKNC
jgi:hypothetical protein